MKEEIRKIYVSNDGRKFLNFDECEMYEKLMEEVLYFEIRYNLYIEDLYYKYLQKKCVAVLANHCCYDEVIVFTYALQNLQLYDNKYIIDLGDKFVPSFDIKRIPNGSFFLCDKKDKLFLADENIFGSNLLFEDIQRLNIRDNFSRKTILIKTNNIK